MLPFQLSLAGFSYADLFSSEGLRRLYDTWLSEFSAQHPQLAQHYLTYASHPDALSPPQKSELLCKVAREVSQFVVKLFGDDTQRAAAQFIEDAHQHQQIARFKDEFIKRQALKLEPILSEDQKIIAEVLLQELGCTDSREERQMVQTVLQLMDEEQALGENLNQDDLRVQKKNQLHLLALYIASHKDELREKYHWSSLQFAQPLNYSNLIPIQRVLEGPSALLKSATSSNRDGFSLTESIPSEIKALNEVHYCLYCHEREKDSCRLGMINQEGQPKKNPLGVELEGCPLDEKISEMHWLRKQGDPVAALAMVCLDNPLCPGTGHRICNDCMKSCVYQKQDPVNTPLVETHILREVLSLPYGAEIYGLLTRFNPLSVTRPFPLPYNGQNILVVGLGPAGYTLAHYLTQEGYGVIGIDGSRIESPSKELTGDWMEQVEPTPIQHYANLEQDLSTRQIAGFGGVSEYGITSRWDKNFLQLIQVTLCRKPNLRLYGGIRFGGTLTLDDAWTRYNFAHVAMATGAGAPTLLSIPNAMARGVRQASDFLMTLQLEAPYRKNSISSLQVRLPALVIGGGLTAVDTATELAAYYIAQAELIFQRLSSLPNDDRQSIFSLFDEEEVSILLEFFTHGQKVAQERENARAEARPPRFDDLVKEFGGVTIVYRKHLHDSPAYRLNHEELAHGLSEGVTYRECLSPVVSELDKNGSLTAMRFEQQVETNGVWRGTGSEVTLPARSAFIAAGTHPNTAYATEYPHTFITNSRGYYEPHRSEFVDDKLKLIPDSTGVFTSYRQDSSSSTRTVSFYGDGHPLYAGSVVKAMASAKNGFLQVVSLLHAQLSSPSIKSDNNVLPILAHFFEFCKTLDDCWIAKILEVRRLTSTIVEILIRAPAQASAFRPGQFFKLQNRADGKNLLMEGIALTGAFADASTGILSLIVLELGASSLLCSSLQKDEAVLLMGPTGSPTELPRSQRVCLIGGGTGNAVLLSIAHALKERQCEIIYFAGYRSPQNVFHREIIEAASDRVIWSFDQLEESEFLPARAQDILYHGNIVDALRAYQDETVLPLQSMQHLLVIGSDRMMAAVKHAAAEGPLSHLPSNASLLASINSPMQCMMKGICAQCLQRQVDPHTGEERYVFSCANQDQPLTHVDFSHLSSRLRQNSVGEKLNTWWLKTNFKKNHTT